MFGRMLYVKPDKAPLVLIAALLLASCYLGGNPTEMKAENSSYGNAIISLSTPTGVRATVLSSSSIEISWNYVSGAEYYIIYRASSSGGTYQYVDYSYARSYTNTGLSSNTTYYYKVSAVNSRGSESSQSAYTSATTTSTGTYPTLTAGTWTTGNIPPSSEEQWFRFTATSSTQHIHVKFGTLTDLYVQLYNSTSGIAVGERANLYSSTKYISWSVTNGQVYYIKVTPYNSSGSGDYQIAFNTSTSPPN